MRRLMITLVCLCVVGCEKDGAGQDTGVDAAVRSIDLGDVPVDMDGGVGADGDVDDASSVSDATQAIDMSPPDWTRLEVSSIPEGDDFAEFFDKRVVVFGVQIVGTVSLPEAKLLHAAHVMAEYLDNDENGEVDDEAVVAQMVTARSVLVMAQTPDELENSGLFDSPILSRYAGQDLYGEEANEPGRFDATLEEVLHLISNYGYAPVYPQALATEPGTLLADAMDLARGGRFDRVPNMYPDGAWYTYDDQTCDYECMATEYLYWALTSMLGAQQASQRCDEITREWRLCTRAEVETRDPAVFQLLSDPQYKLPTRIPNGDYRPTGGQ